MQSERLQRWMRDYVLWAEIFAILNLVFLSLDIYIAHSANSFLRRPEYFPLFFSLIAPILLAGGVATRESRRKPRLWRWIGLFVGAVSIAIGMAGVIYHLDSQFFYEKTIRSLTYAAPFAAPLAYTGIGLILILNRMTAGNSSDWANGFCF